MVPSAWRHAGIASRECYPPRRPLGKAEAKFLVG